MLSVSSNRKLVTGSRLLLSVILVNVFVALDTFYFWIGFFSGYTFPINELKPLIPNFEGYYAWERCFVVPDSILAIATLFASVKLFKNQGDIQAILILAASAGAWIFLGVLDFTYGITNDMYTLGHPFSATLLSIGIGLPIVGGFTLWALRKLVKENLL